MKKVENGPVWLQPEAPLGSAVRYVAGLSGYFDWVGIYVLDGKTLRLGPFLGDPTPHTRIPVGKGVCGLAVARDTDMNVPDVTRAEGYLACSVETRSELVCLVRNGRGQILGQIDIDSHRLAAFTPELVASVRCVADELGRYWPKKPL